MTVSGGASATFGEGFDVYSGTNLFVKVTDTGTTFTVQGSGFETFNAPFSVLAGAQANVNPNVYLATPAVFSGQGTVVTFGGELVAQSNLQILGGAQVIWKF